MIVGFAVIGALIGFVPMGSFLLIPMEVFLLYKIATKYNAFDFHTFFAVAAGLVIVSGALKALATLLQAVPVFGQIANSFVAFTFIMVFGYIAEQHYSKSSPLQN